MKKNAILLFLILGIVIAGILPSIAQDKAVFTEGAKIVKIYAEKYKVDPIVIISIGQRMTYPDDMSVTLFVAKTAKIDPMIVLDSRIKSKKWIEILGTSNINPADIFTPLNLKDKKLPDMYRRAYSEFNKYNKDSSYVINLYDQEIRNLVQLKFCVNYLKMDPWKVIDETSKGTAYTDIITR